MGVMRKPTMIERLYVDFDGFFASVEQSQRPSLRGRPVGVVPLESEHTSLIAASREAKALGIRGIVSVKEARRLAPDIVIVTARPDIYANINRRLVTLIDRSVPILAVRSIDEVVADVSGWPVEEIQTRALAIKAEIAREFGACLTCSIGAASNELLAKTAAEMNKPDGLVFFPPDDLPGPLLGLALRDIPGIAAGIEQRLTQSGILTVDQLWALAPKHARAIWGSVEGERFWAQLHGYAVERPPTRRGMYGHSRVLAYNWRGSERARACARLLVVKAARRMRREGNNASAFSLGVRTKTGEDHFATIHIQPARDDHAFLTCLDRAWPRSWPRSALSISVTLHDLSPADSGMRDLFETDDEATTRARWLAISTMLDGINKRYGRAVVSVGPQVQPPGGYAGAKIAFGRIPEPEDF